MIYDQPEPGAPIRQGDIFASVPKADIKLSDLAVVGTMPEPTATTWKQLMAADDPPEVTAVVGMRPVTAIVITQECDALRAPYISLCEITEFGDLEGKAKSAKSAKSIISIVTQHARVNQKWYYLPPDSSIGFVERMGVNFQSVISVDRLELEGMLEFRIGTLKEVASAHFRERIAEYFRRYAYDEWYPLNKEEFDVYNSQVIDSVEAFAWQQ